MSAGTYPRVRVVADSKRPQILPNAVAGMLIFVFTEIMFFAGLISAFTIVSAGAMIWPPPDQPRLPIEATALNSLVLLASGAVLFHARRVYRRDPPSASTPMLVAMVLAGVFVVFQGYEWVQLLAQGLTLTSSTLGSFFYVIVGLHALHAVIAVGILGYAWHRLRQGWLPPGLFAAAEIFWYFVVLLWPVLYMRVYL